MVYSYENPIQFTDFITKTTPDKINIGRDLSKSFIETFNNDNFVFLDNRQFTCYTFREKGAKQCKK